MKRILLSLSIIFYGTQLLSATTIQVPADYSTIALAIAAASDGDIISIAEGTYTEYSLYSTVDKSLTFVGAGRDLTIIQAKSTPYSTSGNRPVFLIGAITANRTVNIQNLTIQNGYYGSSNGGGGIRVTPGTIAKLTLNVRNVNLINNCTVGNSNVYGGGMTLSGIVDATFTNCTMTGNMNAGTAAGAGGGAIYVASSAVALVIDGCNISNNTAGAKGGGAILCGIAGGAATGPVNIQIKNSTLSANTTTDAGVNTANGGAIKILCGANVATPMAHALWIENSTIYGNTAPATARSGGIFFESAPAGQATEPTQTITLNHCTVANNTSVSGVGGDGVCISSTGGYPVSLVMNNSIVMGNSGSVSNQSQIGEDAATSGKITNGGITNSIFGIASDATWVTTVNNNNLSATVDELKFAATLSADATPVLLTGEESIARNYITTNYLVPALSTDQLGNPRVQSTDAGAWENQNPAVVSHILIPEINAFTLSVVSNGLVIGNISEKATVRVFDIVGKMVANKLSNGNAVEINLNTKGLYTVSVNNGKSTKTVKVIY